MWCGTRNMFGLVGDIPVQGGDNPRLYRSPEGAHRWIYLSSKHWAQRLAYCPITLQLPAFEFGVFFFAMMKARATVTLYVTKKVAQVILHKSHMILHETNLVRCQMKNITCFLIFCI